jgi:hypothetical protein
MGGTAGNRRVSEPELNFEKRQRGQIAAARVTPYTTRAESHVVLIKPPTVGGLSADTVRSLM